MKRTLTFALLFALSTTTFADRVRTDMIRIRSFIDKKDIINVQGDKVWFTHVDGELPGNWGDFGWPTYVNETPWKPAWDKLPNSDIFRMKEPYVSLPMTAFGSENISVFVLEPAGVYGSIIQYPDEWNNWTLSILIDNTKSKRALWSVIEIAWDESLKFRRIHYVDTTPTSGHFDPIVPPTVPSPTPVGLR